MTGTLELLINGIAIAMDWESSAAYAQLIQRAAHNAPQPLVVRMEQYGGNEQVGSLGFSLPRSDRYQTTQAGDVVLYAGNQIVIFYDRHAWSYTKLGRVQAQDLQRVVDILQRADVQLQLRYREP